MKCALCRGTGVFADACCSLCNGTGRHTWRDLLDAQRRSHADELLRVMAKATATVRTTVDPAEACEAARELQRLVALLIERIPVVGKPRAHDSPNGERPGPTSEAALPNEAVIEPGPAPLRDDASEVREVVEEHTLHNGQPPGESDSGNGRSPQLERRLLLSIAQLARRRFRVDCTPYIAAVQGRLALGRERYGDDAFLSRDNIAELLEESPDLGGYALLELQRPSNDVPKRVRDDLLRVVLLAAVADFYGRRAAEQMREGSTA